jgi:hypothetical protein
MVFDSQTKTISLIIQGQRGTQFSLMQNSGLPQFPNKSQSMLTRDRFCGHEYLGTSHFGVVDHLPGLDGTHGESGHDRVQLARVALA